MAISKRATQGLAAMAAAMLATGGASAVPISYSIQALGTGSLGAEVFDAAAFSIVTRADTDDIVATSSGFRVANASAWVTLASGSTAAFSGDIHTVVNQTFSRVGVSDFATGRAILFVDHPGAAGYGLDTGAGPWAGTGFAFNTGFGHPTTLGDFTLNAVSVGSFSASVVPEPASAAMLLAGAGLLWGWRRRATA